MTKVFRTQIDIDADAEHVWAILTDSARYTECDLGMLRLEGEIAQGQQLTIYTKAAPKRAFSPTVSMFEPPHKMVWQSGMPFGAFSGARTFTLQARDEGGVQFSMEEVFSGWMLPVFGGSIPDLTPTFEAFAAALKQRAEETAP